MGDAPFAIGDVVRHPEDGLVKIVSGQHWNTPVISDFWRWVPVDEDGNQLGPVRAGYGWTPIRDELAVEVEILGFEPPVTEEDDPFGWTANVSVVDSTNPDLCGRKFTVTMDGTATNPNCLIKDLALGASVSTRYGSIVVPKCEPGAAVRFTECELQDDGTIKARDYKVIRSEPVHVIVVDEVRYGLGSRMG